MSRREFPAKVKVSAFERSGGKCESCGAKLFGGNIEYDHSRADGLYGEPTLGNCVVLCKTCHSAKTRTDVARIAKAKRSERAHIGANTPGRSFPASRSSGVTKKLDGSVVTRQTQAEKHRATMAARKIRCD